MKNVVVATTTLRLCISDTREPFEITYFSEWYLPSCKCHNFSQSYSSYKEENDIRQLTRVLISQSHIGSGIKSGYLPQNMMVKCQACVFIASSICVFIAPFYCCLKFFEHMFAKITNFRGFAIYKVYNSNTISNFASSCFNQPTCRHHRFLQLSKCQLVIQCSLEQAGIHQDTSTCIFQYYKYYIF